MTRAEQLEADRAAIALAAATAIAEEHRVSVEVGAELVRLEELLGITPAVLLELRHDRAAGSKVDRDRLQAAIRDGEPVGWLFKAPSLGSSRIVSRMA